MAVAMPVLRPKQSERLAATLYSPPETWISNERALRKGTTPGSRRWTRAPRERKSSWQGSWRTVKALMDLGQPPDSRTVASRSRRCWGGSKGEWEGCDARVRQARHRFSRPNYSAPKLMIDVAFPATTLPGLASC